MKKTLFSFLMGIFVLSGLAFAGDGFVASKGSDKFHVPTCKIAKNIKADNLVKFATQEEAIKAGYSTCKMCMVDVKKAAFVASKDSDKFHKPDCRMVGNIKVDKMVDFASQEEAVKAGYKSCSICFPSEKKEKVKEEIKKDDVKKGKKK